MGSLILLPSNKEEGGGAIPPLLGTQEIWNPTRDPIGSNFLLSIHDREGYTYRSISYSSMEAHLKGSLGTQCSRKCIHGTMSSLRVCHLVARSLSY